MILLTWRKYIHVCSTGIQCAMLYYFENDFLWFFFTMVCDGHDYTVSFFSLHWMIVNADDWFLFVLVALIHGIRRPGGNAAGFSCMLVLLIVGKRIKLWSNFSPVLLVNCFSVFYKSYHVYYEGFLYENVCLFRNSL